MNRRWSAYWWRVMCRSAKDAGNIAKQDGFWPRKLLVSWFIVVLGACLSTIFFADGSIWQRLASGAITLVAGLGLFAFVLIVYMAITPWKFENEMVAEYEASRKAAEERFRELQSEKIALEVARGKHGRELEEQRAALGAAHEERCRGLEQQIEALKAGHSLTDADVLKQTREMEIKRWIQSGEKLVPEIEDSEATLVGQDRSQDFLPNELISTVQAWTNGADSYIGANFKDFLERFRSDADMPPCPRGMREIFRNSVYVRVERFKELSLRHFAKLP